MKQLQSNFVNMFLSLLGVTLFAAAAVGGTQVATAERIAAEKAKKEAAAVNSVLPKDDAGQPLFNNNPVSELDSIETANGILYLYPAKQDGTIIGWAVKSFSNNSFGGYISVMVGLKPNGEIIDYAVLEHKDTPGLGAKMVTWFKDQLPGKKVGDLKVSKEGGEVDAITAATISSKAFLEAVNFASAAIKEGGIQ